eukprot:gnl/MRDRNA2_/MRDRNA2_83688_c0_seq2.p1 gnl/MRDRNA2_/MRDRNA2_83688_c0~~gnl/MRDRNA2_/MRDRNA2_83688_c0_seq2.p1  ORF type:complete len:336 (+),score=46.33 gnl/MRDRNA2_/MRDRNA2_83688_c0_seq2:147-1010(+)
MSSEAPRMLFVVPTGNFEAGINVTQRNIEHLRANYPGEVDVFLIHYDKQQLKWAKQTGISWYAKHVQKSFETQGGKFGLLQSYFKDPSGLGRTEKFKKMMMKYNWIWALDEDFDITGIDIPSMMEAATESGSKIVAPAVKFPHKTTDDNEQAPMLAKQAFACKEGEYMCDFQKGNPKCRYSYVNWLEVMTPMFRPEALWKILYECDHCIHTQSLWGLGHVWCKFVADKFKMGDDMKGCTLLDRHPALKLEFHTLSAKHHRPQDKQDVKAHNPQYFVEPEQWKQQCVE